MLQFLEGRQQVRDRPAPAIQPPDQHHVDLAAARGLQQFLPPLPLGSARADFFDLQSDRPTPAGGVFPQGAGLHRDGLLILGRNAGVEARPRTVFWPVEGGGQKPLAISSCESARFSAIFEWSHPPGRRAIVFGQAEGILLQRGA